jgi:hypothetical protein
MLLSGLLATALMVGVIAPTEAAVDKKYGLSVALTFGKVRNGRLSGTFHVRNFGPRPTNRYRISLGAFPMPVKGTVWGMKSLPSYPAGQGLRSEVSRPIAPGKERMAGATWSLTARMTLNGKYCRSAGVDNSDGGFSSFMVTTCVPPSYGPLQLGLGIVRPKPAGGGSFAAELVVRNWGKTASESYTLGSTAYTHLTGGGFVGQGSADFNEQVVSPQGLAPRQQKVYKVIVQRQSMPGFSFALVTSSGASIGVTFG